MSEESEREILRDLGPMLRAYIDVLEDVIVTLRPLVDEDEVIDDD